MTVRSRPRRAMRPLQALWRDLKRRDLEEVQLLDRQLAGEARD